MLLVFDIGNSTIRFGVYQKRILVASSYRTLAPKEKSSMLWKSLSSFFQENAIEQSLLNRCAIASVVPELTNVVSSLVSKQLKIKPLFITAKLDCGLNNHYKNPSKLGADRLCNAVAAYRKFGSPVIVVDWGTATKYEFITGKGDYQGGIIAPGFTTSARGLSEGTALLPKVTFDVPENIIGKETVECLTSGIMYNLIDSSREMIKRLKRLAGKNAIVVGTGGYSEFYATKVTGIDYLEPNLTLEGAKIIFERVSRKKS